jgi:hypothetical protein
MDKKIWLKVIKDELTLLDELATGMIGDISLSREEVELAITRSKIVVQEFEMLLNQFSAQESEINSEHESVTQGIADSFTPAVESSDSSVSPSLRPSVSSSSPSLPVPESQVLPLAPSPPRPFVESPGLPVPESPSPSLLESFPPTQVESPSLPLATSPPPPYIESPSLPVTPSASPVTPSSLDQEDRTEYTQYFKIEPLKSLKDGLSLNDRYLFQRELFNNNKASLDETIATLDRLNNIKEAVDYLKANFKWNKSEASDKFVTLIKRRFSETKG